MNDHDGRAVGALIQKTHRTEHKRRTGRVLTDHVVQYTLRIDVDDLAGQADQDRDEIDVPVGVGRAGSEIDPGEGTQTDH